MRASLIRFCLTCGLISATVVSILTGCGSDSDGGNNNTGLSYTGSNNPAQISAANAGPLADSAITVDDSSAVFKPAAADGQSAKVEGSKTETSGGDFSPLEFAVFIRDYLLPVSKSKLVEDNVERRSISAINVNETLSCSSGSLSLSGQVNDNYIGTVNATFNNCQIEGFTANGTMTLSIAAFDQSQFEITDATFTFSSLTVTGSNFNANTSGTVRIQQSVANNTITITLNSVIDEQVSGKQFKAENMVVVVTFDNIVFPSNASESVTGRVFDSVEGYFDIQTIEPLSYSSTLLDYPDSGGEIILTGASNQKIRVIANPNNTVTLELDLDADGAYELSATMTWDELKTEDGSNFS